MHRAYERPGILATVTKKDMSCQFAFLHLSSSPLSPAQLKGVVVEPLRLFHPTLLCCVEEAAGPSAAPTSPAACRPGRAIRRSPPCETGKRAHGHPRTTPDLSVDRPAPGLGLKAARADWARRKPMLLFRLSALFLLRLAERRFSGLLFQEPPRNTRWPPRGPFPGERRYGRGSRARKPWVSACLAWPIQLCTEGSMSSKLDQARGVGTGEPAQPAAEAVPVVVAQAPVVGKHQIAEQVEPIAASG